MALIIGILVALFLVHEIYVSASAASQAETGMQGGAGWQLPGAIYGYAQNAGFSGGDLITAVAIAIAESAGNADAYDPELLAKGGTPDGKGSYGLWQIYLRDHPEFEGQNLYDPQTNANAAFSVYSAAGESFSSWATFKSLSAGNISAAESAATGEGDQDFSAQIGGW